jgi:hypothetical protein
MWILPKNIIEDEWILEFLQKRNLINQYKKAKQYVLNWINNKTFFKERWPKWSNIWYFRINKQYRAFWSFDKDKDFRIFKISDHS